MQVSLKWLKEFVDIELGVDELAHQLTMLGLEIEKVTRPGAEIKNVVIGKILEIKPHPDADKLVVCQTDIGESNPLQIVCGAKNMKAGDIVPTAVIGATLPGGFEIARRKMRGIESQGMMCSARELGLGKDHDGLLILPADLPIGADAIPLLALDDVIYEIEVTPNRGDWAGMIGVARELAAYFKLPLRLPDATCLETGESAESFSTVTNDAPDLCARYVARIVTDVAQAATPLWMAQRLAHAGQRMVNPTVDITNYVMLETGQPLHAFDLDRLQENRIVVRRAKAGETIRTIDSEIRTLRDDMLVIADAKCPVAIAGVMGGIDSEVGENTRRILFESAWFAPSSIRKTARALGMNTEASQRFQRGADVEMAAWACDRVAQLASQICSAKVASGRIDSYPAPTEPIEISLRWTRTNALLGTVIAPDTQKAILERLSFKVTNSSDAACTIRVPSWRHDATREADLIEEVARMYGYDNIPATVPRVRKSEMVYAPEENKTRKLRRYLVSLGLTEMMNLTFSSPEEISKAGLGTSSDNLVMLQNPLAETSSAMRPSLIPSLLNAASLNIRRGARRLHAFEIGHVYRPSSTGEDQPSESARIGIVLTGLREDEHWGREKSIVDIYDCKGVLENIFNQLRLTPIWSSFNTDTFTVGHAAKAEIDGVSAAWYGQVATDVLEKFGIEQDVFLAEVVLDKVLCKQSENVVFRPFSSFPPSMRDMALLVDTSVAAETLLDNVRKSAGKLLQDVRIFDVYAGKQVPVGKKSIALSLIFQSQERTLTDKDTQKAWDQILKSLQEKCGATLR